MRGGDLQKYRVTGGAFVASAALVPTNKLIKTGNTAKINVNILLISITSISVLAKVYRTGHLSPARPKENFRPRLRLCPELIATKQQ
jgi:hypothetical protein